MHGQFRTLERPKSTYTDHVVPNTRLRQFVCCVWPFAPLGRFHYRRYSQFLILNLAKFSVKSCSFADISYQKQRSPTTEPMGPSPALPYLQGLKVSHLAKENMLTAFVFKNDTKFSHHHEPQPCSFADISYQKRHCRNAHPLPDPWGLLRLCLIHKDYKCHI